jgi:hypothetical protein
MPAHIKNKGERHIDNNGGAKGQKGSINEKQTYGGCCYSHFFAQGCTHTKSPILKKKLNFLNQALHIRVFLLKASVYLSKSPFNDLKLTLQI